MSFDQKRTPELHQLTLELCVTLRMTLFLLRRNFLTHVAGYTPQNSTMYAIVDVKAKACLVAAFITNNSVSDYNARVFSRSKWNFINYSERKLFYLLYMLLVGFPTIQIPTCSKTGKAVGS